MTKDEIMTLINKRIEDAETQSKILSVTIVISLAFKKDYDEQEKL